MYLKQWAETTTDTELAAELAEACEINPFLALLLTTRGIIAPEEAYAYLAGQEEELDPFAYADMDRAVDRIALALKNHEKILIYGDYDVDGITATVLLYSYLHGEGADVLYRIPRREEGYGLHLAVIDEAAAQGVTLLVTVDNGISLSDEVSYAADRGMDIVITDHHRPSQVLPQASAVVDPHRADCEGACKDLAGVGVAFLLVCALHGDAEEILTRYGDLLTLGTLADVIPLCGFTRDLVRRGMLLLNSSTRPGLLALRRAAGNENKELTSTNTVFTLSPRLNAAGRMADPDIAARLLLAEDEEQAAALAQELQECNTRRQTISAEILALVEQHIHDHPQWRYDRVLVVDGRGWQNGVLGIIAAKLLEIYGRPTLVLSEGEDGIVHGSGRSISGFPIYDALAACADTLIAFGGHELAAGVTLAAENVEAFRRAINAYAAEHYPVMPRPRFDIALRLRPNQITIDKMLLLDALEPFGAGNPAPTFGLFRMTLDNISALSGGKHIRLSLSRGDVRINAVKFQTSPEEFPIPCGSVVNCVVALEKNEYRGNVSVSVRIRDIDYDDTDREALQNELCVFESMMRREVRPDKAAALPTREQMARLYTLLHQCGTWIGTPSQLLHAVARTGGGAAAPMTGLQLMTVLEMWSEAGLLRVRDGGEVLRLEVLPTDGKSDLTQTPLWRYLEEA